MVRKTWTQEGHTVKISGSPPSSHPHLSSMTNITARTASNHSTPSSELEPAKQRSHPMEHTLNNARHLLDIRGHIADRALESPQLSCPRDLEKKADDLTAQRP